MDLCYSETEIERNVLFKSKKIAPLLVLFYSKIRRNWSNGASWPVNVKMCKFIHLQASFDACFGMKYKRSTFLLWIWASQGTAMLALKLALYQRRAEMDDTWHTWLFCHATHSGLLHDITGYLLGTEWQLTHVCAFITFRCWFFNKLHKLSCVGFFALFPSIRRLMFLGFSSSLRVC